MGSWAAKGAGWVPLGVNPSRLSGIRVNEKEQAPKGAAARLEGVVKPHYPLIVQPVQDAALPLHCQYLREEWAAEEQPGW